MLPLPKLPGRWREDAEVLERHGCVEEAERLRTKAREVERAWDAYWNEELPVEEAAAESGYDTTTLRQMVRDGRVPDLRPPGSQGRIRIRRRDLPMKPPHPVRGRGQDRAGVSLPDTASPAEKLARRAAG